MIFKKQFFAIFFFTKIFYFLPIFCHFGYFLALSATFWLLFADFNLLGDNHTRSLWWWGRWWIPTWRVCQHFEAKHTYWSGCAFGCDGSGYCDATIHFQNLGKSSRKCLDVQSRKIPVSRLFLKEFVFLMLQKNSGSY